MYHTFYTSAEKSFNHRAELFVAWDMSAYTRHILFVEKCVFRRRRNLHGVALFSAALNGLRRKLCQVHGLTEGVFAQHSRARQIVVQLDDPSLVLQAFEQQARAPGCGRRVHIEHRNYALQGHDVVLT